MTNALAILLLMTSVLGAASETPAGFDLIFDSESTPGEFVFSDPKVWSVKGGRT